MGEEMAGLVAAILLSRLGKEFILQEAVSDVVYLTAAKAFSLSLSLSVCVTLTD